MKASELIKILQEFVDKGDDTPVMFLARELGPVSWIEVDTVKPEMTHHSEDIIELGHW